METQEMKNDWQNLIKRSGGLQHSKIKTEKIFFLTVKTSTVRVLWLITYSLEYLSIVGRSTQVLLPTSIQNPTSPHPDIQDLPVTVVHQNKKQNFFSLSLKSLTLI